MTLSREKRIWINETPFELARTKRTYDKESNTVTVAVRFLSGKNKSFSSEHDTVFEEERPYLNHEDAHKPHTSIRGTIKLDTKPDIINDKLAIEVTPTGKLSLPESIQANANIISAEELRKKGLAGFFVKADLSREGRISTTQDIFPLSTINRIITSERRDLLLVLWETTTGQIKETHYPLSQVRQWAVLTQKELKNKRPKFIAPKV